MLFSGAHRSHANEFRAFNFKLVAKLIRGGAVVESRNVFNPEDVAAVIEVLDVRPETRTSFRSLALKHHTGRRPFGRNGNWVRM